MNQPKTIILDAFALSVRGMMAITRQPLRIAAFGKAPQIYLPHCCKDHLQ